MSELTEYMKALANERREHAEKMHRLESTLIEYHEAYENIAELLGINIGHESWWDQNRDVQYQMIIAAINSNKWEHRRLQDYCEELRTHIAKQNEMLS